VTCTVIFCHIFESRQLQQASTIGPHIVVITWRRMVPNLTALTWHANRALWYITGVIKEALGEEAKRHGQCVDEDAEENHEHAEEATSGGRLNGRRLHRKRHRAEVHVKVADVVEVRAGQSPPLRAMPQVEWADADVEERLAQDLNNVRIDYEDEERHNHRDRSQLLEADVRDVQNEHCRRNEGVVRRRSNGRLKIDVHRRC